MSYPTRTRTFTKKCDSGVTVTCEQKQENRAWGWIRGLFSWWVDVGTPECEKCPKGPYPKDRVVTICCTAGSVVKTKQRASGPGPVGALGDLFDSVSPLKLSDLFGPTPLIEGFAGLMPCIKVNADVLNKLIENMEEAEKDGRSGLLSRGQVQTQQEAIKCLKKVKKNLNW